MEESKKTGFDLKLDRAISIVAIVMSAYHLLSLIHIYLKRRIASNLGHLSNDGCAKELTRLVRTGSTRFILGHLSENSNTPEMAYQSALTALTQCGMHEGRDFLLQVARRSAPSEMVTL